MKRKLKILLGFFIALLFIVGCYLIYNMKDDVEPIEKVEEVTFNDTVTIKKRQLDNQQADYYYVEFNFVNKTARMYKVETEENVREGEAQIIIYKEANLYLNETELKNYQKNITKIYNNPYKYSFLNYGDAKDLDKDSNDYYEIEFSDTKYFIYEKSDRQIFDKLFD